MKGSKYREKTEFRIMLGFRTTSGMFMKLDFHCAIDIRKC